MVENLNLGSMQVKIESFYLTKYFHIQSHIHKKIQISMGPPTKSQKSIDITIYFKQNHIKRYLLPSLVRDFAQNWESAHLRILSPKIIWGVLNS